MTRGDGYLTPDDTRSEELKRACRWSGSCRGSYSGMMCWLNLRYQSKLLTAQDCQQVCCPRDSSSCTSIPATRVQWCLVCDVMRCWLGSLFCTPLNLPVVAGLCVCVARLICCHLRSVATLAHKCACFAVARARPGARAVSLLGDLAPLGMGVGAVGRLAFHDAAQVRLPALPASRLALQSRMAAATSALLRAGLPSPIAAGVAIASA